ncbi:hypothetical protein HK101_006639, partial [Irineochytrium annulatum]
MFRGDGDDADRKRLAAIEWQTSLALQVSEKKERDRLEKAERDGPSDAPQPQRRLLKSIQHHDDHPSPIIAPTPPPQSFDQGNITGCRRRRLVEPGTDVHHAAPFKTEPEKVKLQPPRKPVPPATPAASKLPVPKARSTGKGTGKQASPQRVQPLQQQQKQQPGVPSPIQRAPSPPIPAPRAPSPPIHPHPPALRNPAPAPQPVVTRNAPIITRHYSPPPVTHYRQSPSPEYDHEANTTLTNIHSLSPTRQLNTILDRVKRTKSEDALKALAVGKQKQAAAMNKKGAALGKQQKVKEAIPKAAKFSRAEPTKNPGVPPPGDAPPPRRIAPLTHPPSPPLPSHRDREPAQPQQQQQRMGRASAMSVMSDTSSIPAAGVA